MSRPVPHGADAWQSAVGGLAGHLSDEGTVASAATRSMARVRWLDTFWEGCCVSTGTVWCGT